MMSALVRGMLFTRQRQVPGPAPHVGKADGRRGARHGGDQRGQNRHQQRGLQGAREQSGCCNSWAYQSRVKPPHTALDLESLKEKTISTKMGA